MITKELAKIIKPASVDISEDHVYRNRTTGELYTGVTTIAEAWDKSYFLAPWTAKEMALEILATSYDKIIEMGEVDFGVLVNTAKSAARRKGDKAKKSGDIAHKFIAREISSLIEHGLVDDEKYPIDEDAHRAILAYEGWKEKNAIHWLASEMIVASDVHKVGGTLDAIAIVNGIPTLIDFKTSSQLSASYLLQCGGYDLMLEEMGLTVAQYMIVRLPKDGKPAEVLTRYEKEERQFIRETFLRQREAHKFYVYVENQLKGEDKKIKTDA